MKTMNHKCRVWKLNTTTSKQSWATECYGWACYMRRGYVESETWEEAMLEALFHRMRNR
jgi:hypothetical protein